MAHIRSYNSVILLGRLGKDPSFTPASANKKAFAKFSMATTIQYGEDRKVTDWHYIQAFGKTAEICGEHLSKGSLVLVEGKLTSNYYGNRLYINVQARSVVMLGKDEDLEAEEPREDEEAPY